MAGVVAREVCRGADRALCLEYQLLRWVDKPKKRRHDYFAWCDLIFERLSVFSGLEPYDECLINCLIGALRNDMTFSGHLHDKGGSFLVDDANWEKLYRAGATAIYQRYLDEVEARNWP
jgi:hypothetical protein